MVEGGLPINDRLVRYSAHMLDMENKHKVTGSFRVQFFKNSKIFKNSFQLL